MGDAMPCHGAHHSGMVGFVGEFRRVHADHHETVPETPLEVTQFVDDAETVDAAEGPEIEHHRASAQVAQ